MLSPPWCRAIRTKERPRKQDIAFRFVDPARCVKERPKESATERIERTLWDGFVGETFFTQRTLPLGVSAICAKEQSLGKDWSRDAPQIDVPAKEPHAKRQTDRS